MHNKPTNPLKSIKEQSSSYEECHCETDVIAVTFKVYLLCMQKNGKSLLYCTRSFKVARKALTSCLRGPIDLKKQTQDQPERLEGQKALVETLTVEVNEKLATHLYLICAQSAQ